MVHIAGHGADRMFTLPPIGDNEYYTPAVGKRDSACLALRSTPNNVQVRCSLTPQYDRELWEIMLSDSRIPKFVNTKHICSFQVSDNLSIDRSHPDYKTFALMLLSSFFLLLPTLPFTQICFVSHLTAHFSHYANRLPIFFHSTNRFDRVTKMGKVRWDPVADQLVRYLSLSRYQTVLFCLLHPLSLQCDVFDHVSGGNFPAFQHCWGINPAERAHILMLVPQE